MAVRRHFSCLSTLHIKSFVGNTWLDLSNFGRPRSSLHNGPNKRGQKPGPWTGRRKQRKKGIGNTLYAKGKELGSTDNLLGLLDDFLHNLLDHRLALVLATGRRILGQLG